MGPPDLSSREKQLFCVLHELVDSMQHSVMRRERLGLSSDDEAVLRSLIRRFKVTTSLTLVPVLDDVQEVFERIGTGNMKREFYLTLNGSGRDVLLVFADARRGGIGESPRSVSILLEQIRKRPSRLFK